MKAKVLSVYDEGSLPGTPLIGAKGLAILVDVDGERTMFGTGLRGNYLMHNMDHLSIDPNSIGRVVVSHMHSDHIGGLPALLEARNDIIDVFAPPDHGDVRKERIMGIPVKRSGFPKVSEELSGKMNIVPAGERTQLSDHLLITELPPADGGVRENVLVLTARNGTVMICGCCHCGPAAAIAHVGKATGKRITAVVGGTHLTGMKKEDVYEVAVSLTESGPPALYLSHCSGVTQKMRLRERLGLKAVNDFYVGTEIQFDL